MKVRVLLVDDHAVVREGLARLLEAAGDLSCEECSSAKQAFAFLKTKPVDVVLLDISMPGTDGFEALRYLREHHPSIGVVLLTMLPEEQYAVRALRMGAHSFLGKSRPSAEIVNAIRLAARGERYVTPTTAELLVSAGAPEQAGQSRHACLTNREFEILRLLGSGRGQTAIAKQLGLSVKTVATHKANMMEKMGFNNIRDIMVYTIEEGLL